MSPGSGRSKSRLLSFMKHELLTTLFEFAILIGNFNSLNVSGPGYPSGNHNSSILFYFHCLKRLSTKLKLVRLLP